MIGFPMDNMVTMAHFIFTGILDRFPKLRLGILESNAGWANFGCRAWTITLMDAGSSSAPACR